MSSEGQWRGTHLPERWAVLEQAFEQMEGGYPFGNEGKDCEAERAPDLQSARSSDQLVCPAADNPGSGEYDSGSGML